MTHRSHPVRKRRPTGDRDLGKQLFFGSQMSQVVDNLELPMKTYGLIMTVYGMVLVLAVATMLVLGGCDSQGGAGFLGSAATGPVTTYGPLFDEDSSFGDTDTGRRVGNDECRLRGQLDGVSHQLLSSGKASYEKRGNVRRLSVQVEDIDISLAGQTATVIVGGQVSTSLNTRVPIVCPGGAACLLGGFDLNLDSRQFDVVPDFTGKLNCADAAIKVTVLDELGRQIVTGMMTIN